MEIRRRGFLQVMAAGLAAASGSAMDPRPAGAQLTPFKIGPVVLEELGLAGPILIGMEKGFFRDDGLAVEMIPFKGGPDLLKGVLSGSVTLALSGATDPLVFRERGTPIRAVAVITEKNYFVLVVAPRISRLDELKGGTIGVSVIGATTWVFARMLAKKMGWDPERDIRIVGVGGYDASVAGMRRGELQAFVAGTAGAVAETRGVGRILMRLDEATPSWTTNVAYATEETITTRKAELQKALRGLFRAMKFMRDNTEETVRICSKGIGWPEPATRRALELIRPLLPVDGRFDLEAFRAMQDTLLELGVLKKRLPLADHYTTEFTPVAV